MTGLHQEPPGVELATTRQSVLNTGNAQSDAAGAAFEGLWDYALPSWPMT